MARVQEVKETKVRDGSGVYTRREVHDETEVSASNKVVRLVWFVAGVILALLAIRFVLALLGANPANPFANFIYDITYPLVAPFFGLFSYDQRYGVSRLEIFTLVAMLVYGLVAYGIVYLIETMSDREEA